MQESQAGYFVCVVCESEMQQVPSVPVLQSLTGHAIYHCAHCGHIVLVQEDGTTVGSTSWLASLPFGREGVITCAMFV